MKLIKFLVNQNIGSRRECFSLIKEKRVKINNKIVDSPTVEINPEKDIVKVDDKIIKIKPANLAPVYILMNKPGGVVCTLKDEKGRPTIFDLIKHHDIKRKHLFYAGRLDYKTEGAIFITNDGEFANFITHPRYNVLKYYYVEIKGEILDKDIEKIRKGLYFEGEFYKVKDVKVISRNKKFSALSITLNEGKNREIRKIFQIIKYKIKYLKRYKIGPFELPKDLLPGYYKLISKKEIEKFKNSINKK